MPVRGKVRIIGGIWRKSTILFPNQDNLRPTPDRVRETVFNWLGQDLTGLHCLDLFAGSGVLGFEAASRGAKQVVMVESHPKVHETLQENKEKLNATQVELIKQDALTFIQTDIRRFDIIFLDPPYRAKLLPDLMSILPTHLESDGLVYLETGEKWTPDQPWQVKRHGKAGQVIYHILEIAHGQSDLSGHV